MRMTLREISKLTGSRLSGDGDYVIDGAAGLAEATKSEIAFLENPKYGSQVMISRAGAVFLPPAGEQISGGPPNRLYSVTPRWAYAQVLEVIYRERWKSIPAILDTKADIHFEAKLGKDVDVGPFAVIKRRTLIGERTRIGAHCYIGNNVRVGKDCVIHPNVVIQDYCELGDRVIVQPGAVIGSDGYGYWTDPKTGQHKKVAQVGRVVVESDVEIGACVTLDRATTGETRIGAGTKIDNLVQVGHNCVTGRNCIIISQVGMAGTTRLGHQVTLAGQVGLAGHLSVGDGAIITAQTGVMRDVPPKAVMFGSPARPHREAMKLQAIMSKLPEMYAFVKQVRAKFFGKETTNAKG
ncbi:UDP-3-O-(3-hydroxymyristoyl)glucosamine N-acyltransferase [Elusimicrobiota bacterium]